MTAPKPGDRVRVEYEATYQGAWRLDSHTVEVNAHGEDFTVGVPAGAKLTVLPKALRVGDKVRPGVDPEPPIGAVLVFEDGTPVLARRGYGWTFADDGPQIYTWGQLASWHTSEATVVWLPGGAS